MLLVDLVGALALVGFEGLDGVSGLLHRAGHEPAHGVLLPAHLVQGVDEQMHLGRRVSPYVSA